MALDLPTLLFLCSSCAIIQTLKLTDVLFLPCYEMVTDGGSSQF